jgi:hypothetical protein
VEAEETAAARTASAAPRRRRRAMVLRSASPASGGGSSEVKRERRFAWVFTCFGEKWRAQSRMPPSFALGFNNLKDLPKKTQREARKKKAEPAFHVILSSLLSLTFFSYIWPYLKFLKILYFFVMICFITK